MAAKDSTTKGKDEALQDALKAIERAYGKGSIMRMGEQPKVDVDVIPTGSLLLDATLGVGGYPRGRIIEIYGPESSGKSTLALHAVAECQKKGGRCAYIDAEHAIDPDYADSRSSRCSPRAERSTSSSWTAWRRSSPRPSLTGS